MEIIIYNLVFWSIYGALCYMPEYLLQRIIETSD